MGYFSNGTEGMQYQERYCERCVHDVKQDCPVWLAHLTHNYGQKDAVKEILSMLIPREGIYNGQCKMFIERK